MVDDFGSVGRPSKSRRTEEHGVPREYLRPYETIPAQVLNVYGPARYATMTDEDMWMHLGKGLGTGAASMTELRFESKERRGVGINRWLHAVKTYMEYNKKEEVQKKNQKILRDDVYAALYSEMEEVLPHVIVCLAPRKQRQKSGASSLRSGVEEQAERPKYDEGKIKESGKALYEWLDSEKVSVVRGLMNWQAGGGCAFVASTHHRACSIFRKVGNSDVPGTDTKLVTMEEFQDCIQERWRIGDDGTVLEDRDNDFK